MAAKAENQGKVWKLRSKTTYIIQYFGCISSHSWTKWIFLPSSYSCTTLSPTKCSSWADSWEQHKGQHRDQVAVVISVTLWGKSSHCLVFYKRPILQGCHSVLCQVARQVDKDSCRLFHIKQFGFYRAPTQGTTSTESRYTKQNKVKDSY